MVAPLKDSAKDYGARRSRVKRAVSLRSRERSGLPRPSCRDSVEFDPLSLFEAPVAVALDVGEMDEDVITLLTRDKSESLFCVEKLYSSLCHEYSILKTKDRPFPSPR